MAVGKTLAQTITQACHEAGLSAQSALNQDVREAIKAFIVTEQETVLDDFDWPELKGNDDGQWFDVDLAEGQRYYDWPTGMDWLTVTGVWFQQGSVWVPVERGISVDDYSSFDSDSDVRADPVMKWDYRTEAQIEVWPIPASVGALRIAARRKPSEPVAESAVLVIDHIVLAKRAAASYLRTKPDETGEMRKLAQARYAEAAARLTTLRARRNKHRTKMNFASHGPPPHPMDPRTRIRVVG